MHLLGRYVLLLSLWCQTDVGGDNVQPAPWDDWSTWSLCSAQCGHGISTRSRQCLQGDAHDQDFLAGDSTTCLGPSSQTKVCNLKPCPPEETSRNQKSCSEFNSRMFSGKQYMWEPIIHQNAACKMSCRAKGVHFYANLADRAEDGTPCKLGTADAICVTGVCKRIGCDGVVDSAAVKDNCGVCSGNGSSCQTISGIFTSTELKRGLNHIISIPAGSTNINITELQASRNLLIMQTGAGTTFINDDATIPTSRVVEAAGTVFTYSAKSLLLHKESIFSPGPTNTSVILKLLMRESNPGIMYTFNVPKEVSGTIIQQIRHHSRPVELSAESKDDQHHHFEAFSSNHDDSIPLKNHPVKPGSVESSFIQPLLGPHDQHSLDNQDKNQESSNNNIINHDETTSTSFSETLSITQNSLNRIYDEDSNHGKSVVMPNLTENDQDLDGLFIETTSHTTAGLHQVPGARTIDHEQNVNYWDTHKTTEASPTHSKNKHKHMYSNDNTDVVENVDQENVNSELTKMPGIVPDNEIIESYKNNNNREGNNGTEPFSNSPSSLARSAVNDHKGRDGDDSLSSNEDQKLLRSTQTLNPMDDTRDMGHSNSNREIDDYQDIQSKNPPKGSSEPSTFVTRQQEKEAQIKTSHSIGNSDNFEKGEESSPKSQKNHSSYKIPRYSQSFTFVERYKDNKLNHSSNSSQQSKLQHTRHQHSQQKSGFIAPSKQHNFQGDSHNSLHSTHNQQTKLDRTPYRNIVHVRHSGVDQVENKSIREPSASAHIVRSAQSNALDRYQSDKNEQISRESHLRDRQIIVEERRLRIEEERRSQIEEERRSRIEEERRIRLEEQRSRYKQRLREYNERLKQRQVEIDGSRRQSSHSLDTPRKTDSQNSVNHRGPHHETNPSLSSRDGIHSNAHGAQYYGSVRKTHSPEQDRTDTSKDTQEHGRSHVRNGNTHTYTGSEQTIARSGHRSDTRHQEQLDRTSGENSQKDTSWRRQTVYQPSRRDEDTKDNNNVINRESGSYKNTGHNSEHQVHREISSGQESSPNVPVVIQPPNLEYPESFDRNKVNSYPSRIIPRVQPSVPQYIQGGPARATVHSALSGGETQQESLSNKISGENHISSSRQPTVLKPVGLRDIFPNHIPVNKLEPGHNAHSSIYEWRISGLTDCTHSCGGGIQQTVVVCVDTLTQAVVTDENCRHIPKPKQTGVACNTRPCSAEWTPGAWSSCSVTCGKGEQTRTVTCQARVSPTLSMTMPSSNCESQEQIPSRQICSNKPCSFWRVGIWSNCSTPCGDGHKTRDVQCVDLQNNIVSDDACSELMPDSEERCNLGECGKGWFFTDWPTECPAECGVGEVTRKVFCADDTGSALPDSRCDVSQRPAVSQSCRVSRPCGGLWFTGQWSKCDAKCGSGNKRRLVLCIKELPGGVRAVVDAENCEGLDKPAELEPCQVPPCTSEWYMTSWSQCSQSCGTGYSTREVKCLDPDQKPHDDCLLQSRPKTRDACNTHNCVDVEAEGKEENQDCVDKFTQCNVVKRARLCQYSYYKTACCKSCADDT